MRALLLGACMLMAVLGAPVRAGAAQSSSKAHPTAKHAPAPTRKQIMDLARTARTLEEAGAYTRAAAALRALRAVVAADADLDLELALDLARSARPDSAAMLLGAPPLTHALTDSMPLARRHLYPWEREPLWTNGQFDGWHWYVARARAEVAAMLGRWHEARVAAEACIAARPLAGQEWLVYAVCAGRDDLPLEAGAAARFAALLDPTLPEAQYLAGLYEWRLGHVQSAQRSFRAAVALDSTWRLPALALVRSRLMGVAPDSLPVEFLVGLRAAGLLTSPARPKVEEFVQMDESAVILRRGSPQIPDSVARTLPDLELALPVLVDLRGHAVLAWMPWIPPSQLPPIAVSGIIGSLNQWRFKPAMKNGSPQPVWATIEYNYQSAAPPRGTAGGTRP